MKRRMVQGGRAIILPVDTVRHIVGLTIGWCEYQRADEVLLDGLIPMWFGGVKVSAYRGRVLSRWT